MPLILYYQDQTLENMQYNKKCKICGNDYVYIGTAQNGYMWYCRKCKYIDLKKTNNGQKTTQKGI